MRSSESRVSRHGMRMLRPMVVALAAVGLVLLPAATATPDPTSVTIAGSLQSEAGCCGDWDPACATTHLTYDAADDVWQGTFALPAGSYEYKAALNDAWDENYGLHAELQRRQHPDEPRLGRKRQVLLRPQDPLGDRQQELGDRDRRRQLPVGARLPGRLGSRLPALVARGPGRQRHLLVRDDGSAGGLVRDEGDDQRGLGRELRPRRRLQRGQHPVLGPGQQRQGHVHLRRGDARAHDPRGEPERRARRPRRALALRPRAEGLPRHGPQHDLEGVVHGRERRAQRHVLPDGRQHERRDAAVRRQRRLDVHRSPDAGHDLRGGGGAGQRRDGVQGDGDGEERQVPDRDHLPHRSRPQHGGDAGRVQARSRRIPTCGCTSASTRR